MRLLIISHTPHYLRDEQIVGWGATLREIDALSQLFESIVHIAPLYPEPAPESSLPYTAKNIQFRAVSPAGGDTLRQKFSILGYIPGYLKTIKEEMKGAEIIHVRCPSAISLVALFVLMFFSSPKYRWVKYAGNWHPTGKEAWSYTIQRWMLQNNLHRGVVTVNGKWPEQPDFIHSFPNPCLTQEECTYGKGVALTKELKSPFRLLFVGQLVSSKGVGRIIEICGKLKRKGISFQMELVGDGPEREIFTRQAADLQISDVTHFHGWLPRPALSQFYSEAHFIIFPSASEGWPKVLSEAMAYGVVPIASNVSSIPQILQETHAGLAFPPETIDPYVQAIADLIDHPSTWKSMSQDAVDAAEYYTYDHYLRAVQEMMKKTWKIDLHPAGTEY